MCVLSLFTTESHVMVGRDINTRTQSHESVGFGVWVKIYFFAGITVIVFLPYSDSERVKRHRALPMKVFVKTVTAKCLGGPSDDRDRLTAHS
ncbi:hypothetical protein TNCV_1037811 [Trichonephila clavipes]|nr:hypothetical protein TNCV_1037811 [Trichonephila clavipes]